MQDNTIAQPATDQSVAQPTAPTMPAADVTMTPVPAVDVNTAVVTETPAPEMGAVTETPAPVAGPAPVEVPVELPNVSAPATPVATETPVTPTV